MQTEKNVTSRPCRNGNFEIHQVNDRFVLFETPSRRVHYLNPTAVLVWEMCDGTRSCDEIAALVQEAYGLPAPPTAEVSGCIANFAELGIVH